MDWKGESLRLSTVIIRPSSGWVPLKRTELRATPFYSPSPYGIAKQFAYWVTANYREPYGMYTCYCLLFNHEISVRSGTSVTRKITRALARIKLRLQDCLYLGNLAVRRDWGHARDYVEVRWLILQQE